MVQKNRKKAICIYLSCLIQKTNKKKNYQSLQEELLNKGLKFAEDYIDISGKDRGKMGYCQIKQ